MQSIKMNHTRNNYRNSTSTQFYLYIQFTLIQTTKLFIDFVQKFVNINSSQLSAMSVDTIFYLFYKNLHTYHSAGKIHNQHFSFYHEVMRF